MTYTVALSLCAVVLALLCIGLMAVLAHHSQAPRTDPAMADLSFGVVDQMPAWPEFAVRGGFICLLVSFVTLMATCLLIVAS
ncbi:hypothetical protein [Paraburkholderia sp. Ac-20347]|jgi:hypothetical protein|uniref:hypothetical protein n=1 Tax=Paraburkholderia sp. Ac-20347 TaxID=2703892 RepID=UPI0019806A82|nr:hypothetical protein [Paraburkholderia sp. Ac-20347]MBN3813015.1 hypothetical protein [Paraburkholderia sp. Ac-20347]